MPTSLLQIIEAIETARKSSQLAAPAVTILGACKGQSAESIRTAARQGVRDFGENRVQEAEGKWLELKKELPNTRLHLIGPLQTNKVREAVALFDVIQTVDRIKLAGALAQECARAARTPACYIQVNTGREAQKAGCAPEEVEALVAHCRGLGLRVEGLMCVPPVGQHPGPHFAWLREKARALGLAGLSMGMSEDYLTAVRMGATCVRLGRVLFGERATPQPSSAAH